MFQLLTVQIAENKTLHEHEQSNYSDLTVAFSTLKNSGFSYCSGLATAISLIPKIPQYSFNGSEFYHHPSTQLAVLPSRLAWNLHNYGPSYSKFSKAAPTIQYAFSYDETKYFQICSPNFLFLAHYLERSKNVHQLTSRCKNRQFLLTPYDENDQPL